MRQVGVRMLKGWDVEGGRWLAGMLKEIDISVFPYNCTDLQHPNNPFIL